MLWLLMIGFYFRLSTVLIAIILRNCKSVDVGVYLHIKPTNAREVRSRVCESWLPAAVRLRDGDLLDELERLEDVGDVVQAPDARLHDCLGQPDPVDHARGKVQVDLGIGLQKLIIVSNIMITIIIN